jgi:type VI secretion system secreted protein Hcp
LNRREIIMADIFYASIKTDAGIDLTSGAGPSATRHPNESQCHKLTHEILIRTHPDTGLPIDATPFHRFLTITKEIDKSTPGLYDALLYTKVLTVVLTFERPRPDGAGGAEQFFWIALERARIISIAPLTDRTNSQLITLPNLEEVSFRYGKITWKHKDAAAAVCYDFDVPSNPTPYSQFPG